MLFRSKSVNIRSSRFSISAFKTMAKVWINGSLMFLYSNIDGYCWSALEASKNYRISKYGIYCIIEVAGTIFQLIILVFLFLVLETHEDLCGLKVTPILVARQI